MECYVILGDLFCLSYIKENQCYPEIIVNNVKEKRVWIGVFFDNKFL